MSIAAKQITWRRDLNRALEEAQAQSKRVLLDFSAAPM
jgi:hypothetical protein